MDAKKLQQLDEDLAKEEALLEKQLGKIADKDDDVKGNYDAKFEKRDPSDTLDEQAQSVTQYEERRAEEQLFEVRLKKIKKIRQRIKDGTYGTCVDCDTNIPMGRLTANPVASRCVPCSEKANLV